MKMKLMPIVYVTDMPRSVAFYEKLGLTPHSTERTGMWFEFAHGDAVLALHATKALPRETRMSLGFVAIEPLEEIITDLRDSGLAPEDIVDEAFGRSFRVFDPDGNLIQISEHE